jgi:pimeloyl-ACP methyl ester carboxylesterase
MKTRAFRIISVLLLAFVLLISGVGIAGVVAKANLAKKYPAPGQLVDAGGHKLHINCIGQGSPTVILEAGMGEYSLTWAYVQPEVAGFARVCSYDRAGFGWSEPGPNPRTAGAEVEDLHRLLVNASVEKPYVLVGHSMGGMLVRMYAHQYPDEVVGLVLVDSLHEERISRLPNLRQATLDMRGQFRMFAFLSSFGIMALAPQSIPNPGLPDDAYLQAQAITATSGSLEMLLTEMNLMAESSAEALALHMTSFGNLPLIVLSSGQEEGIPSLSDAENQQIWEELQTEQSELTALSSASAQIIAEQSGHYIQLDQPDLVIGAIREVVKATQ